MLKIEVRKIENDIRFRHSRMLSSAQVIPIAFLCLILSGALLLMLPAATAPGEKTTFLTALFTSTTSVCVTGSVVVDTYSHWSLFGKIIILHLIQIGGLGIVAVIGLAVFIKRQKFSLSESLLMKDSYNLDSTRGISSFLGAVFSVTLLVEALGAIGYMPVFIHRYGLVRGIWYSVFTSVSAFCNAGIDILGPDSLTGFRGRPLILIDTMVLIVLGGIGYVVLFDVIVTWKMRLFSENKLRRRYKSLNEHTRLVLMLTALYIIGGAVMVFFIEYNNPGTIGDMPLYQKILNSLFQSVTYRTAGFSTFPQENMTETSAIIGMFLMFTGGSPVGTAGGVKTVTMFVLLMNVLAFIHSRDEVIILNRRITPNLIRKATAIITVHFFIASILCICLMLVTNLPFIDAMFEIMSAVSTVGLSRGVTADLNHAGQWIVILAMYLGRIGPISMLLFFHTDNSGNKGIRHAVGRFIIG